MTMIGLNDVYSVNDFGDNDDDDNNDNDKDNDEQEEKKLPRKLLSLFCEMMTSASRL